MSAPITAATSECPATPTQSALWAIHQMDPTATAYHVPLAFSLQGPLDTDALSAALEMLVARHGILRTVYVQRGDAVMQRVLPALPPLLAGGTASSTAVADHRALANAFIAIPFDLERTAPIRARLWSCVADAQRHLLVIVLHRIAVDRTGLAIFLDELTHLYAAYTAGAPPSLEEAPQFAEYATRLSAAGPRGVLSAGLDAWQEALAGHVGVIDLSSWNSTFRTTHQATAELNNGTHGEARSAAWRFAVAPTTVTAVRALALAEDVTPFTVLLSAFQALLHLHTGRPDVIVGVPFANRGAHDTTERAIGRFAHTLPVPVIVDAHRGLRSLLAATAAGLQHAEAFRAVPFDAIVERVRPPRAPGRNPLFQVGLSLDDPTAPFALDGLRCTDLDLHEHGAMYDLHCRLVATSDGGITGTICYDARQFAAYDIRTLVERYAHVVATLVAQPDAPIDQISVVTATERLLLSHWNDTAHDWPATTLVEQITARARATPAAIAVRSAAGSLTYAELVTRADRLAEHLTTAGVRPGDLVGLSLARDLGMMVAPLAVLMTGAAYVPLDPEYPTERLSFIAQDAGITALLVDPHAAPRARERLALPDTCAVIALARSGAVHGQAHAHALARSHARAHARGTIARHVTQPDDIAYVIYTSGSTGRPKGVAVPHRAVQNFLRAMSERPGFNQTDRLLAVTTLSFDISVLELFLPLVCGGTVVIADHAQVQDGAALAALIDTHSITLLQATPGTWRLLLESGWRGTPSRPLRAFCGGEPLAPALASALRPNVAALWNLYGPTETTVWSTRERILADGPITIGRPLENTTCCVLSPSGVELPPGIVGELVIGGAGVSAGYLDRPELTAASFVADPLSGGVRYRTGDRAVRTTDGRLVCLGRLDEQVKVNGNRVELGEIEALMEEHPLVREAVVRVSTGDDGDNRLVAYVVTASGEPLVGSDIRRALRARVPDFMVPAIVLPIAAVPRTPNGKRDRAKLPDPFSTTNHAVLVEPRTEIEHTVAKVWSALLGVERVSVHDNFFEIGGTSLLAICAATRLRDQIGVRPDPRTMFFQTLEQIATGLSGQPTEVTL